MGKITFETVMIELTRRCNMRCGHCFRGEAQNVDINCKHIDALLEQTEMIGELVLTGGEPTLNMDAMEYLLDRLCERGIPVLKFQLLTNGLIYSERFIEIMKGFSEVVEISRRVGFGGKYPDITENFIIGISMDRYHELSDIVETHYAQYKRALLGKASVLMVKQGNAPRRVGRAENLPTYEAVDTNAELNLLRDKRIEILDSTHKPMCEQYDSYRLLYPDQKIVCCGVYLDAKGILRPDFRAIKYDYYSNDSDEPICSVGESDIWSCILEYNKGRKPCPVIRYEIAKQSGIAKALMISSRESAEDCQNELTKEQQRNAEWSENQSSPFGGFMSFLIALKEISDVVKLVNSDSDNYLPTPEEIMEKANSKNYLSE